MRVTQQILFDQALTGVRRHSEAVLLQQQQIASGRRWLHPSEDPTAAAQSLTARARRNALEGYTNAVMAVRDRVLAGADALQQLSGLLAEVKEAAVASQNTTLTDADRAVIAEQLDGILTQVVEIANHRDGFGYLFGGTSTETPYAFVQGKITYQGDDALQKVPIGDALQLATTVSGPQVFSRAARKASEFFGGITGAKPGTGTDSALNRSKLSVLHESTTYGDGTLLGGGDSASGLRPAASSPNGDTVIGPPGAHSIQIDEPSKTISLNGGPAVPFIGSETDLSVADGKGGIVRVNVSSLTSGFVGTVSIEATGSLSTDGGATRTTIGYSTNQIVVHGETKKITNINSTGIRYAGTEVVDHVGTTNLFEAIAGLRDDLRGYGEIPVAERQTTLRSRQREVERNLENVLVAISDLGARAKVAESAHERLTTVRDQISGVISNLEDTDLAEVVVNYNQSQLALQLAQAAGSRLMQTNFLAFLQ
ncbi:MAG: flagellar hook-associated protein FlgL [Planctomycetes bacterium]|nr:flagellar hook-associated protein FlgL [Planctomycetota bacterium]